MEWKNLSDNSKIDLVTYVGDYVRLKPNTKIFIGTDSQNKGRNTWYALIVMLYEPGKGAHVLYARERHDRINDMFTKLFKEVDYSIQIAEMIRDSGVASILTIDIDFNVDKKYKSNALLLSALGWCAGLGFETRSKPEAYAASYAADMLVKKGSINYNQQPALI